MNVPLTIGDVFRNAARAVPARTAAVLEDSSISFGELHRMSNRVVHTLQAMGVGRGDRVAVWSGTSLDAIPLFAGLAKLGAVFAPIGSDLSLDEARPVVMSAFPKLVVTDRAHAEPGGVVATELSAPLVRLDGLAGGNVEGDGPGIPLRDAAAAATERDVPQGLISEGDPHVVFFTSGSSGRPKGALLSHRVNYLRSHPGALLEPRGPMVCPYPLFHMGAWTIAMQQWQARDIVILTPSAEADVVTRAVETHQATRLNAIPAVWRRILERPEPSRPLESLRFADTGTSSTPVELLEAIERVAPNAHVRVFYGSTEAGSVTSLDHVDIRRKPGSCGVPGPGTELRLDDEGEVWVRSPLLFDGYLDDRLPLPPFSWTAGIAPVTSRPRTRRDISPSWDGRATSSAPVASRSHPPRWSRSSPWCRGSWTLPSWASRTRNGARWCARPSWSRRVRHHPPSRTFGRTAVTVWRASSTRAAWSS